MYQVLYKNYLLHDSRTDDYILESPNLIEELNKVSEFTFSIYPNHPYFHNLEFLKPGIEIKKDGLTIFKGRIISDKSDMNNIKQVSCESALAFLLDSIQRPFSFQGSPNNLFYFFVNNHNNQVGAFTKTADISLNPDKIYFKFNENNSLYEQVLTPEVADIVNYYEISGDKVLFIGKVTGANLDNNVYINRSNTDYLNTFDSITEKLIDTIGGYFYESYIGNKIYVNWVDDFTDTVNGITGQIVSTQTIEFGENLIDLITENDANETFSVVIPLGAESEDENGIKQRLTIESVNDGKDYLVNEEALEKYGWVCAPVDNTTWDDITIANNLKSKALEYLNNIGVTLKSILELNALDLNVLDKDISAFKKGEYIEVKSTPHGLSKIYLLTKKETPLNNPENMKVTLGETQNTLTGIQLDSQNDLNNKVQVIYSDYVTNAKLPNLVENSIEESSIIKQLSNQISTTVQTTTKLEGIVNDTVASITSEYKIQGSSDEWSTTFPNRQEGQIVLRRNKTTYVDGTVTYSAEEEITGDPGDTGPQGPQGEPGVQGIQGPPGEAGTSSYFYVRYSANADGNPMTTTPTDNSKYMGVASTTSATAPTSNTDYIWSLIKGADGQSGSPGAAGENGQTSYLHIKYSEDGQTFTPADDTYSEGEKPSAYIGQYVDFTEADSTNFDDYNWYKFTEDIDPTLSNLQNQIDNNSATINNNYQNTIDKMNGLATSESVTQLAQTVETLQTSTEYSINVINETLENGVSKVKTDKGFTFSNDGLDIDETNSPTKFNADTDGITVTDKTGNVDSELLYAGYDSTLLQSIVRTANLLVRTYLMIGNNHVGGDWRMEIVDDPNYGLGIGFFFMGDD